MTVISYLFIYEYLINAKTTNTYHNIKLKSKYNTYIVLYHSCSTVNWNSLYESFTITELVYLWYYIIMVMEEFIISRRLEEVWKLSVVSGNARLEGHRGDFYNSLNTPRIWRCSSPRRSSHQKKTQEKKNIFTLFLNWELFGNK